MKAAASISVQVSFKRTGQGGVEATRLGDRTPRVSRFLALAHQVDAKIRSGELRGFAHAAKIIGVTRARMTQLMNLLLLAPDIQEEVLDLPPVVKGRDPFTERQLRPIVAEPDWSVQLTMWRKLPSGYCCSR